MFQGFTEQTFEFFMAIRFNNNREFFLENHDWYQSSVRTPCLDLAAALGESVNALDPELETRPTKVLSRINRDVRFSNDKSPYRDYLWLAFRRPGEERRTTLGVYVDVSDEGINYGMGFYDENLPLMKAFRATLENAPAEFLEIAAEVEKEFELHPKAYKRMKIPDAVPEALRKWYPLRGFYVEKRISDYAHMMSKTLDEEIAEGYRRLTPLYRYFTRLTPIMD